MPLLEFEAEMESYQRIIQSTLSRAQACDYAGYSKHDGLNSPFLSAVLGHGKWPRLAAIQLVMRCPWNIRPLLGVSRTRNAKGLGLFACARLDLYAAQGRDEDLYEATKLLEWLLANPSQGFKGLSWGYPHPWQDVGLFAPRHSPNRVVTCWVGFAFAEAVRLTEDERFRDALERIAEFLTEEPNVIHDDAEMTCYRYVPDA